MARRALAAQARGQPSYRTRNMIAASIRKPTIPTDTDDNVVSSAVSQVSRAAASALPQTLPTPPSSTMRMTSTD